jgi:hypothetical protein
MRKELTAPVIGFWGLLTDVFHLRETILKPQNADAQALILFFMPEIFAAFRPGLI